ncbi:hypothetical protein [Paracoccus homiensis]|uniref:Uncharacterized protein n=1 Tax=Paracoccus homiensis TaxID=364199 RepID=A0A1I0GHV6_9RHOB|nr:hypothetical protein [Paracoccus homiensis]SET69618.1 hypothetical protein SAMN04489858_108105 [Paracoccus homiensis]
MADKPLFLERASFRRRRLGDAARVLPILALIGFMLPVWWLPDAVSFASGIVWLFGLWAALIVAIFALHRALIRAEAATIRASGTPPSEADWDRPDAV